jgi:general secretion pathway protein B
MSYILEALKKAQAERQLGNAPDIHTPAPVHVPAAAVRANRKPLLVGLGVGLALAGLAAGIALRGKAPPAVPAQAGPVPAIAAAPAPAVPVGVPAAPAAQVQPASRASEVAVAPAAVPPAAPPAAARPAAPPASAPAPRMAAAAPASPPAVRDIPPEAVYLPAPARAPEPAPVRAPDPVAEENLRTLQQLPEAIQREVPKVAVGGYIYSPNPADRLLLVDRMLRREGEELAPGLVLERLMPKYAVMNYRGTRYRVGY